MPPDEHGRAAWSQVDSDRRSVCCNITSEDEKRNRFRNGRVQHPLRTRRYARSGHGSGGPGRAQGPGDHRPGAGRHGARPDGAGIAGERRCQFVLYDRVRVEPTDESFLDAIAFARQAPYDAYVAVGGGSTIDTAKAVNLYVTYPPSDFLDYVNPPIGKGIPVPGPLKPLIAIPTTAGTGSETTGVSIFDLTRMHAKTGIASRRLKPTLGLLDPENTRSMPPQVAASSGLDILSHAIESYTALPYTGRPYPDRPLVRPAYQGSNPISDVWSLQALRMVARVHRARGRRSIRR